MVCVFLDDLASLNLTLSVSRLSTGSEARVFLTGYKHIYVKESELLIRGDIDRNMNAEPYIL